MFKININASDSIMSDKLYKLLILFQSFLIFELIGIKFELDVILLMILCLFQLKKVKSILNQ